MQQHPIPQNVMSVEFQLVGSLTLRQFAYLAAGGVFCLTLFILPIYGFIKWPLILMIAALSGSTAFLPINDIGLDRWIIAFFRAINSPTKRIWIRNMKELPVFSQDYSRRLQREEAAPNTNNRARLNSYLAGFQHSEGKTELDVAEESYISSLPFEAVGAPPLPPKKTPEMIAQIPTTPTIKPLQGPSPLEEKRTIEEKITPAAPSIPPVTTPPKPVITVHMPDKNVYVKKVSTTTVNRVLHSLSSLQGVIVMPVRGEKNFEPSQQLRELLSPSPPESAPLQFQDQTPPPTPPPPPVQASPPSPTPQYIEELKMPTPPIQNTPATTSAPRLDFDQQLAMETKLAQEAEEARAKLSKPTAPDTVFTAPQVAPKPVDNPASPPITPKQAEAPAPELAPQQPIQPKEPVVEQIPTLPLPEPVKAEVNTVEASPAVGKMAPLPATMPNVIVGLVRSSEGLLLTDVVIVVKDIHGEPVRALKSNKVGQFAITTALPNGIYTLDLNKDGYRFDTIKVTLNGQIFQPIEIKAK